MENGIQTVFFLGSAVLVASLVCHVPFVWSFRGLLLARLHDGLARPCRDSGVSQLWGEFVLSK